MSDFNDYPGLSKKNPIIASMGKEVFEKATGLKVNKNPYCFNGTWIYFVPTAKFKTPFVIVGENVCIPKKNI